MKNLLSYKECQALKGISILFIVVHNLLHCVTPFRENEKYFNIEHAQYYIQHYMDAPVMSFFSYFGWIGVAVFVFLSGYGLSLKYSNDNLSVSRELNSDKKQNNSIVGFITNHYKKLLTLAFIPYMISLILHCAKHLSLNSIPFIFPDLLFIRNFLYSPVTHFGYIWPPVYWYLGLCFELYVYYALCNKYFKNKWFIIITLGISLIAITLPDQKWIMYIKYHFLGWLPAFYLGYFAAKIDINNLKLYMRLILLIFLIPLFLFTSLNASFWFISDVIGILCFIAIVPIITNKVLAYIGAISSCIFVCHPIIRTGWFALSKNYMNKSTFFIITSILAYVIVCIAVSYLYSRLLKIIKSKF